MHGFNHNVSHVLVFTTFDTNGNDAMFGDEGKWRWMARIAAQKGHPINETDYGEFNQQTGAWEWNDLGKSTVIYKLMTWGKETKLDPDPDAVNKPRIPSVSLKHFELAYFSKGPPIHGQFYALVAIYEVKYG